jgi:hypothetical protein
MIATTTATTTTDKTTTVVISPLWHLTSHPNSLMQYFMTTSEDSILDYVRLIRYCQI